MNSPSSLPSLLQPNPTFAHCFLNSFTPDQLDESLEQASSRHSELVKEKQMASHDQVEHVSSSLRTVPKTFLLSSEADVFERA